MKCTNCGNEILDNNKFCAKCGTKVDNTINIVVDTVSNTENKTTNVVNQPVKNNNDNKSNMISDIKKKINPKLLGLIIGGIVGLIFIIMLIVKLTGLGTNLIWNEAYSHYKLEYVTPNIVKLGIDIEDDKLEDVKIETTCGKTERIGYSIDWDLKDAKGKCKIEVSYKLKKISKEYTVISYNEEKSSKDLVMDYEIDYDSDEDLDYDGLTNKEEKGYKTNPEVADSDLDGLSDSDELMTHKTDPNKSDSDSDGLNDYDELKLGLDPLKADSKGDGVKDGQRKLTYNYANENITIDITGTGNIASLTAQVTDNTKISSKKGMIDKLYTFYTDGKLEQAVIKIKYTDEDLTKYGVTEDNLSLYYYNTSKSTYEKVNTIVDKDNNILTVTLTHFSNYVVGDTTLVNEKPTSHVLFVLDNSSSMYGNNGSDPEGERFKVSATLVNNLENKSYQLGLSEFRSDYANIYTIGNKYSDIKNKLGKMNGTYATRSDGTNITNALNKGMAEFNSDADSKVIILLTDGKDSGLERNIDTIISSANNSNIKICTVGFGDGISSNELEKLATGTGCKFYSSSDSDGLSELFSNVEVELSDDLVDVDQEDDGPDGILLADSGFIVNRDGFSFDNYASNLAPGHCYGMALFTELYYTKKLPLKVGEIEAGTKKSYAYDLTNTYFSTYGDLYDYRLKTEKLKYIFGYEYFDLEKPLDLYELNENNLSYSSNYRTEILGSQFMDVYEVESKLSSEKQLELYGVTYDTADKVIFDETAMQNSSFITKEEKMLFNAIYTAYIRQNNDNEHRYYTSGSWRLGILDLLGGEEVEIKEELYFIGTLNSRLNDGDVPVLTANFSGGGHAVNAISLIQDIDNPNYYYIGVYDNNYPGEKRYVDVECKDEVCLTVANDYYTQSGQPLSMSISLENELQHYTDVASEEDIEIQTGGLLPNNPDAILKENHNRHE